jgi:hypothetical protein
MELCPGLDHVDRTPESIFWCILIFWSPCAGFEWADLWLARSALLFGSPVHMAWRNRSITLRIIVKFVSVSYCYSTHLAKSFPRNARNTCSAFQRQGADISSLFRFREAELPYCASALGPMRPPKILTSAPSTRVSEPVPTNRAGHSCYVSSLDWLRPVSQGRAEMGTQR